MIKAALVLGLLVTVATPATVRGLTVELTAPSDGTEVPEILDVKGKVSDPKAQVWVIVHPMDLSDYWVQQRVTVKQNGDWKVKVHVGEPGKHIGKEFEVRAVANPKDALKVSPPPIHYWPEAEALSDTVEVKRGR